MPPGCWDGCPPRAAGQAASVACGCSAGHADPVAGSIVRREPVAADAAWCRRSRMSRRLSPASRTTRPAAPLRRPRQESLPLPRGGLAVPAAVAAEAGAGPRQRAARAGGAAGQRAAAGDGAVGLRRAGQHRGDPSRAGGDAVRTGAGAGHPQRPGDRAGRRRGAQPVGDGGAHRHRAGPQRHRHRGAERQAGDRVPVGDPVVRGGAEACRAADAGAGQGHQRRSRRSPTWRACRI